QKSASWYLNELADSKVTYFYQDLDEIKMLQIDFEKKNWMHLTGLAPVYQEWADNLSEQFIEDIASGNGNFANLSVGTG
ncbi:PBECR4 domain-containing protein, partial [Streptococcus pyogenes]